MYDAKPRVANPCPPKRLAEKYQEQTDHDKDDEEHVSEQDQIGGNKKKGVSRHGRNLPIPSAWRPLVGPRCHDASGGFDGLTALGFLTPASRSGSVDCLAHFPSGR
jgi:hypothetical protein